MAERYVLTALPWSVAPRTEPDDPYHVSVFVAPRLSDDGRLDDNEVFVDWPAALDAGASIVLSDHTGTELDAAARLVGDTGLWALVFPPDLAVKGWTTASRSGTDWRSYPATFTHQLAKVVHGASMVTGPTDVPPVGRSALSVVFGRVLAAGLVQTDEGVDYDESRLTEAFDRVLASVDPPPLGAVLGLGDDPAVLAVAATMLELHRARRFFERPESVRPYRDRPDPTATNERPVPPGPEFHERVTLLGDLPALLRRLGLVIDLEVEDLDRLASARWLTARIGLADHGDLTLPTRVRCRASGDALVTVGRDGGDWADARLRLGDTARFSVLDLDADASALKLERFLWTLPRLAKMEANEEPATSAPGSLRSTGLTIVRNQRAAALDGQLAASEALSTPLAGGQAPLLHTEDVNRGMRVEVWDDTTGAWFTLHARSAELAVVDGPTFTVDEHGFIQGSTPQRSEDTPADAAYLHEAVVGWSGWSLSAPHPALTPDFQYDGPDGDGPERTEKLVDPTPPDEPSLPVLVRHRVAPGTLPRLRYGRSYAFRAWSVDLAGNSPPHGLGPPPRAAVTPLLPAAESLVAATGPTAPLAPIAELGVEMRGELGRLVAASPAGLVAARTGAPPTRIDAALADLGPDVAPRLVARIRRDIQERPSPPAATRRQLVATAMRPMVDDGNDLLVDLGRWTPSALASAATLLVGIEADPVTATAATVTALQPMLRWKPVEPPVVVPRRPYTAGESLRHLVIRSGVEVTRDPDEGDSVTVVDPLTYANAIAAVHPEWNYHDTSERHIAPPQVSQAECELHGTFDDAIGATDAATRDTLLQIAVREAGSFLDTEIPSLTDPTTPIELPHVALVDPPLPEGSTTTLPDLATRRRGDPLAPGQYVVHDTDEAVLPYLPDPVAYAASLVFPDAGLDRHIVMPLGIEGTIVPYPGAWPEPQPLRMVLGNDDWLSAAVDGHALTIGVPAGDTLRFRLSSAMTRADLELFGLWRSLPEVVRDDENLAEAAADGWTWWLTPADEVVVVHAVPRPLEPARPTVLAVGRTEGDTHAQLLGAVDVHGASTGSLDCEAAWTDVVDDIAQPGPAEIAIRAVAFTTQVQPDEDLAVLALVDSATDIPGFGVLRFHAAQHQFGDTKHRRVDYRFRATTRYLEYFHPSLVAEPDDRSVIGPVRQLSVPSSARPPKLVVRQVLPLYRWDGDTEPEQPFGLRRRRRAGIRVYLERPWYATGEGELVGVILAGQQRSSASPDVVSQWGADPIWRQDGPAQRSLGLELDHLVHATGLDDRQSPARPVGPPAVHRLVDEKGTPEVVVLGYEPRYNEQRGLWYVDVAIDPGTAVWPFIRLVVARYQPDSLDGLHLSPIERLDFQPLPLDRTATLTRPDAHSVRVVVSGPVGHRDPQVDLGALNADTPAGLAQVRDVVGANRVVTARLERLDPSIGTDLGWETLATAVLTLQGYDSAQAEAAWVGTLELPDDLPPRRPGSHRDLRVTVEEIELLPTDYTGPPLILTPAPLEPRVVYADHLPL